MRRRDERERDEREREMRERTREHERERGGLRSNESHSEALHRGRK